MRFLHTLTYEFPALSPFCVLRESWNDIGRICESQNSIKMSLMWGYKIRCSCLPHSKVMPRSLERIKYSLGTVMMLICDVVVNTHFLYGDILFLGNSLCNVGYVSLLSTERYWACCHCLNQMSVILLFNINWTIVHNVIHNSILHFHTFHFSVTKKLLLCWIYGMQAINVHYTTYT